MSEQAATRESRSELFAQQALQAEPEGIKAALRGRRVVIGLPSELAGNRNAQIGLITAVNILTRLGPLAPELHLDVPAGTTAAPNVPLVPQGEKLGERLLAMMRALARYQSDDPHRGVADDGEYPLGLFIGRRTRDASHAITVGSDGWLGIVNPHGEKESCSESSNPLGIVLAATLASIELVKQLWIPIKDPHVLMEPLTRRAVMSAFDLSLDAPAPENPPIPAKCKLGHACVFGLGAIGSGCNYVLGCLPDVEMSLDLVDMDVIEATNEERLFTSAEPEGDIGQSKVFHAQTFLRGLHGDVRAFAYRMSMQRFVDFARERLGYVWCCLDTSKTRRELQTELPSVVTNGGTDSSRWMLSIHEFDRPENACLRDLYPERPASASDPVRELADLLHVPPDEVCRLAARNGRLEADMIARAKRRETDPAKRAGIARYGGMSFEQAVTHMCSTMRPSSSLPAATISFLSLMPAIFMVADLVKRRLCGWRLPEGNPNVFQFDCLRTPGEGTVCNVLARDDCLCRSARYRKAFKQRQRTRQPDLERVFRQAAAAESGLPGRAVPGQFHVPRHRPQPRVPEAAAPPQEVPPGDLGLTDVFRQLASVLLWLAAITSYLAGMSGSLWAIHGFVQAHTRGAEVFAPWLIVSVAWTAKMNQLPWLRFAVTSALPLVAYYGLTCMAAGAMRWGTMLYRRGTRRPPIAGAGNPSVASALAGFFILTGLPCMALGAVAFAIFGVRAAWILCRGAGCFAALLLPVAVGLVLGACSRSVGALVKQTREKCARVFPARGRRKHRKGPGG